MPTRIALVAAGSLALGFGVAELTGVRALGGIVLVAGAAWCAVQTARVAGSVRAGLVLVVYLAAFALSHAIADALGAWGAVALVATLTAAAAYTLASSSSSAHIAE